MSKIFWFDTETTGLNPKTNAITELSALIEIDGDVVEELTYYIKPAPGLEVDPEALKVQGRTLEEIYQRGEYEAVVFFNFKTMLSKYIDKFDTSDKFVMGGYNVGFDDGFLREFFIRNNDKYYGSWFINARLDVLSFVAMVHACKKFPVKNFKLATMCECCGIPLNAHRALDDIIATRNLFKHLKFFLKS